MKFIVLFMLLLLKIAISLDGDNLMPVTSKLKLKSQQVVTKNGESQKSPKIVCTQQAIFYHGLKPDEAEILKSQVQNLCNGCTVNHQTQWKRFILTFRNQSNKPDVKVFRSLHGVIWSDDSNCHFKPSNH